MPDRDHDDRDPRVYATVTFEVYRDGKCIVREGFPLDCDNYERFMEDLRQIRDRYK